MMHIIVNVRWFVYFIFTSPLFGGSHLNVSYNIIAFISGILLIYGIRLCIILIDTFNFFVLLQNNSLIESVKNGDLSGVEDALSRGANVNTTDLVS